MNKNKIIKFNNSGSALILTLLILASILVVSLGAASLIIPGIKMSRIQEDSTKAYFAAEAGAERSLWEVRKNTEFDLPNFDQDNIFSETLDNRSSYSVDYATTTPIVTFTSKGMYLETMRSVAISF